MDASANNINPIRIQLYPYRWIILLVYCLYSFVNFFQLLQYSIISNIIEKYYNVNSMLVNMTGLSFMISYILLFLPFNYLLQRYNLKITAIASSGLTTFGNLLKLLSVSRDRFYLVIIAQALCGIGQVFMISIPSKLASTWFGPNEVSTACAVAIFGTQLGIAIGSVTPALVVRNSQQLNDIGNDLFTMLLYNAVASCIVFVIVILFFRSEPQLPPSQSQLDLLDDNNDEGNNFVAIFKGLMTNKNFVLILAAFGISTGIWNSLGLLLSQIYSHYFSGQEADAGLCALLAIVAGGCFGSIIFGFILDKTHQFKSVSFLVILAASLSLFLLIYTMTVGSRFGSFLTITLFGFFMGSTLVIGFEFATEISHPLPAEASCSVLNTIIYIFAIIFTLFFDLMFSTVGYTSTCLGIAVALMLSSAIVYFVLPQLLRREANNNVGAVDP